MDSTWGINWVGIHQVEIQQMGIFQMGILHMGIHPVGIDREDSAAWQKVLKGWSLLFETVRQRQIWLKHVFLGKWDSLHARLNSYYVAWSYKKEKPKKIKAYRKSVQKEPTIKRCLLILV